MKIDIRQGLSKLRVVQLAMGVRDDYRMDPVEWGRIAVGGFDVAHDEVEAGFDKVLRWKGQAVAVYIREQFTTPSGHQSKYKFHLTSCGTVQGMRTQHRGARFTVTARQDGWFECRLPSTQVRMLRMLVCRNCLSALNWDDYRRAKSDHRQTIMEAFALDAYFHTYQNIGLTPPVPHPIPNRPRNPPPPRRPPKTSARKPLRPPGLGIPPVSLLLKLPSWVPADTDFQFQAVLGRIHQEGSVSLAEVEQMVGGHHRARRFATSLGHLSRNAPYRIRRVRTGRQEVYKRT